MQERRSVKFMLALSRSERGVLDMLAETERLSAAAVIRRLIWRAAEANGGQLPATYKATEKQAQEASR